VRSPDAGAATGLGQSPTIEVSSVIDIGQGSAVGIGQSPLATAAANSTAQPGAGIGGATGLAASILISALALPAIGTGTAQGFAPAVSISVSAAPAAGSSTGEGQSPIGSLPADAAPAPGVASGGGVAPDIVLSSSPTPDAGAGTGEGYIPNNDDPLNTISDNFIRLQETATLRWSQEYPVFPNSVFAIDVALRRSGTTAPVVSVGLSCYDEHGTYLSFVPGLLDSVQIPWIGFAEVRGTVATAALPANTSIVKLTLRSEATANLDVTYLGMADTSRTATPDTVVSMQAGIANIQAVDINAMQGTALAAFLTQLDVQADGTSARVTTINTAVADLDGFAAAFVGITAETSGGHISGFRATSYSNPDGTGGGVLELLGDVIVPGTLATNALTVGLQQNQLPNSDFRGPLENFVFYATSGAAGTDTVIALRAAGGSYAWPDAPTFLLSQPTGSNVGWYKIAIRPVIDAAGTLGAGFAVTPGEKVSFSARVSAHDCEASLELKWYDTAGDLITGGFLAGVGTLTTSIPGPAGSSTNPRLWPLLWGLGVAPATAAYARPIVRKDATASAAANSQAYVAEPMLAVTHADATSPTPYSPPATTFIHGNMIRTGTITADQITVTSLAALNITIGAADIADASISSAKIENAAITSAKLAGTIQSDNYVTGVQGWQITKAGAIEADSLVVRSAMLEAGAASATSEANAAANTSLAANNSIKTLATVTIAGTTGSCIVLAQANIRANSTVGTNNNDYEFWIERGATRISLFQGGFYDASVDVQNFNHIPHAVQVFALSGVPNGTYTLKARQGRLANGATLIVNDARLTVMHLKK